MQINKKRRNRWLNLLNLKAQKTHQRGVFFCSMWPFCHCSPLRYERFADGKNHAGHHYARLLNSISFASVVGKNHVGRAMQGFQIGLAPLPLPPIVKVSPWQWGVGDFCFLCYNWKSWSVGSRSLSQDRGRKVRTLSSYLSRCGGKMVAGNARLV